MVNNLHNTINWEIKIDDSRLALHYILQLQLGGSPSPTLGGGRLSTGASSIGGYVFGSFSSWRTSLSMAVGRFSFGNPLTRSTMSTSSSLSSLFSCLTTFFLSWQSAAGLSSGFLFLVPVGGESGGNKGWAGVEVLLGKPAATGGG